jgi:hypothetical protein
MLMKHRHIRCIDSKGLTVIVLSCRITARLLVACEYAIAKMQGHAGDHPAACSGGAAAAGASHAAAAVCAEHRRPGAAPGCCCGRSAGGS